MYKLIVFGPEDPEIRRSLNLTRDGYCQSGGIQVTTIGDDVWIEPCSTKGPSHRARIIVPLPHLGAFYKAIGEILAEVNKGEDVGAEGLIYRVSGLEPHLRAQINNPTDEIKQGEGAEPDPAVLSTQQGWQVL